jgi:2-methylcitrate dehydratase PrpD
MVAVLTRAPVTVGAPSGAHPHASDPRRMPEVSALTHELSDYIAQSAARPLEPEVADEAKKRIVDTMIAMLSGSHLKPGRVGRAFVLARSARGGASIAGTRERSSTELAALANGMAAHADETDDANDFARIHPGASIVPAALAVGEADDIDGNTLLRAVALGYNVAIGMVLAIWPTGPRLRESIRSTHGVGQLFGATAAAACAAKLAAPDVATVLSYSVQQCSGVGTLIRDREHVEKAYAIGGMQAHNGVLSVELVRAGFTGVSDVLDNKPSFFDSYTEGGDRTRLMTEVAGRSHLLTTDMKRYPVGFPIQAAAQAMEELLAQGGIRPDDVAEIECRLPATKSWIVDNRPMPDVNVQYILSAILLDGRLTFASSHDYARLQSREVRSVMERVRLVHDKDLDPPANEKGFTRRAHLKVTLKNGAEHVHKVDAAKGSRLNPMGWDDLQAKAHGVLAGLCSASQIDALIDWGRYLDRQGNIRAVHDLFAMAEE